VAECAVRKGVLIAAVVVIGGVSVWLLRESTPVSARAAPS